MEATIWYEVKVLQRVCTLTLSPLTTVMTATRVELPKTELSKKRHTP